MSGYSAFQHCDYKEEEKMCLPDSIWMTIFQSIGPGHYRYVGGVSKQFNQLYRSSFGTTTATIKSGVASIPCAMILLKEMLQQLGIHVNSSQESSSVCSVSGQETGLGVDVSTPA